jgi:nucleoside-diphosphate-sugar epimerase
MRVLVCGAGGFIGTHLVTRLKSEGHYVIGVDLKYPEFSITDADVFEILDLREMPNAMRAFRHEPEMVFQLAADMGGAGFVFSKVNDAAIMHNSAQINLNVGMLARRTGAKVFYTSSACIYPDYNQTDPDNPMCSEDSAYPANPDSNYGWEKLFSERYYEASLKNIRVARLHNIYGPLGTYDGGREKAPAAMCRKVALAKDGDSIEVWGDGLQTRSFLYIDACIEAIMRFTQSDFPGPLNIGSEEMVTINQLAQMAIEISGKELSIRNVPTDVQGVRGRNSDNALIQKQLGWSPEYPLREGMEKTYGWIEKRLHL